MFLNQLLALSLAPALAFAAIFPAGTHVKSIDENGFKMAMKESVSLLKQPTF
jgi:hypothetical protein